MDEKCSSVHFELEGTRWQHKFSIFYTSIVCEERLMCKQIVEESKKYFGFLHVSHRIDIRTAGFLDRFSTSEKKKCVMSFTIRREDT